VPAIRGIDRRDVVSGAVLHKKLKLATRFFPPYALRWLTKFYMPLGKKVVVIGGALQGCELAEFLVKRGREVTIIEKADMLGDGMVDAVLGNLITWFHHKNVGMITGVKEYMEIGDKGLVYVDKDGVTQTVAADTFVSALPLTPNADLAEALKGRVPEVYAVGDCAQPGLIRDAIKTGWQTAMTV
jgi:pyruvate/2-oxoglutarate dehydrogenase complex dihydrolipoamide dehydrogenase (E3) component